MEYLTHPSILWTFGSVQVWYFKQRCRKHPFCWNTRLQRASPPRVSGLPGSPANSQTWPMISTGHKEGAYCYFQEKLAFQGTSLRATFLGQHCWLVWSQDIGTCWKLVNIQCGKPHPDLWIRLTVGGAWESLFNKLWMIHLCLKGRSMERVNRIFNNHWQIQKHVFNSGSTPPLELSVSTTTKFSSPGLSLPMM